MESTAPVEEVVVAEEAEAEAAEDSGSAYRLRHHSYRPLSNLEPTSRLDPVAD